MKDFGTCGGLFGVTNPSGKLGSAPGQRSQLEWMLASTAVGIIPSKKSYRRYFKKQSTKAESKI
jgi:hypothetical protein